MVEEVPVEKHFPDMEKLYALVVSRGLAASFEQFVLNTGGQKDSARHPPRRLAHHQRDQEHLDPTAAMRSRSARSETSPAWRDGSADRR